MLRFTFIAILSLGLFSFANAGEMNQTPTCEFEEVQQELASQKADIDPVVRRAVLKQCTDVWPVTFVELDDAYNKGMLTITEVMYGTNLAYDVLYDGNFLCVLDSSL